MAIGIQKSRLTMMFFLVGSCGHLSSSDQDPKRLLTTTIFHSAPMCQIDTTHRVLAFVIKLIDARKETAKKCDHPGMAISNCRFLGLSFTNLSLINNHVTASSLPAKL